MKALFVVCWLFIACSSTGIKPQDVKEISKAESEKCSFVDDLNFKRENLSEQKLKQEIRIHASQKKSNAFVIDERINNGKKVQLIGSLFNCSR